MNYDSSMVDPRSYILNKIKFVGIVAQIDSTYELKLTITNKSGTRAHFKLYSCPDPEEDAILGGRDKPVALSTYGDALQMFKDGVPLTNSNRQTKHKQLVPNFMPHGQLPVVKIRRVWYPTGPPYPEDDWNQHLAFYPSVGVLERHQSCSVKVRCPIV